MPSPELVMLGNICYHKTHRNKTLVEEITKAERAYPYDYKYISRLTREAKKEKWIETQSVDEALTGMKRN